MAAAASVTAGSVGSSIARATFAFSSAPSTSAGPPLRVDFTQRSSSTRWPSTSARSGLPAGSAAARMLSSTNDRPSSPRGPSLLIAPSSAFAASASITSPRPSPTRSRYIAPIVLAVPRSSAPSANRFAACPSCRRTTPASVPCRSGVGFPSRST